MAAIRILLVDDNKEKDTFFEPLADLADNILKAELVQAHTFVEMKTIFEESPYEYQGLILDGKGQKSEKSKTEDDSFLNTALKWIRAKAQEGLYIPYVIYSGYADELKKFYDDENIYWKAKNEEQKMLQDLHNKIQSGEYYNQCTLFPDVFELFELNLLNSKYKPDLVKATQLICDTYTGNIEDVLRSLRPVLESTLYTLDNFDKSLLNTSCFKRERIELASALYYLGGSPKNVGEEVIFDSKVIIPLHIFYLADTLRKITNNSAMHHYEEASSRYLVKSCSYALIEYLLWYKKFVKENYLK